jgi:Xaa-Pro aminopeptidase
MIDITLYRARRAKLLSEMQAGIAVIPTAAERLRNRDSHYPYRYDSYFYYLTGFTEPEALLVLIAGDEQKAVLFAREKDPEREIWDGFRYGPEAAKEAFGFDEAHSITKLDELAPQLISNQPRLFYPLGMDSHWDQRVLGWLNGVRALARTGVTAPAEIKDARALLDEMRLKKDAAELALMRGAAAISGAAHRRAMRATRPGMREFEIEAELIHEFRRQGAQAPAYSPIVAGGANACVLHYVGNDAVLHSGDLLLIDAGCELGGYASDITRTFPVNGGYSRVQRDIYELVLEAQQAAIDAVRPGAEWDAAHNAAVEVLAQGMIDLGLLSGGVDAAIEAESYKRFYMHRTGHWLGLDVHDAGDYKRNGEWRALEAGMVLTVEPGCYVRPAEDVPERFWNIGVRIEDDVLVTDSGNEVLSAETPKRIADIEALMAER